MSDHQRNAEYEREPLPSWAGVPTFLRAPVRDIDELAPGMVAVVGVPHDATAGSRPGTRYGPRAIRETSLHLAYYFQTSGEQALYDIRTSERIRFGRLDELLADVGDVNLYPADVARTADSIQRAVAAIMRRGAFPVVLGGDHYITYPSFLGFAGVMAERGARRVGYIQLDGHFDLADESSIWGKHFHGSNARRASEHAMLSTENMVWIGTSGYTRTEQWDWIHEQGGHVFTIDSVRRNGARSIARRAVELASAGTDAIYLTIDIDCLSASFAPGTGSYNVDGMTPRELLDAVDVLANAPVGAFDFVEVAPTLDPTGVTERIAAVAILDFLRPRLRADQG
jgi:arginase family enzyme